MPRGDAAIRGLRDAAPGGVDGLIDAAVLDAAVLPAIRDGGKLATVRGFAGPSERGIAIEPVRVTSYLTTMRRSIGWDISSPEAGSPCAWPRPFRPSGRPTRSARWPRAGPEGGW